MNAHRANVWSAVLGAAACLVLLLLIAILSGGAATDVGLERPSTYFTDATGARAAYLVLEQVRPRVERWRRPLSDLAFLPEPPPSSMIVLGPRRSLGNAEADTLDAWLASGGQLILATDEPWPVNEPRVVGDRDDDGGGDVDDDFDPVLDGPGYLERHGVEVDADVDVEDAVAAARVVTVGAGRIVHVPNPYAFSNTALGETDNAVWLVDQVDGWGGAARFDEYHHFFGQQQGLRPLMASFLRTPWGFVCLQFALAGAVHVLGVRRRFGRPIDPLPPERTSPLETVDALGALFEAADARPFSARAMNQYVCARLSAILLRPVDLTDPDGRRRASERIGVSESDLETYAEKVTAVIAGAPDSDRKLIEIGRQAARIRSSTHGNHERGRSFAAG